MTEGKREHARNQLAQQFRGLWLNNAFPFPLMADVVFAREAELVKALEAIRNGLKDGHGDLDDTRDLLNIADAALTAAGKG